MAPPAFPGEQLLAGFLPAAAQHGQPGAAPEVLPGGAPERNHRAQNTGPAHGTAGTVIISHCILQNASRALGSLCSCPAQSLQDPQQVQAQPRARSAAVTAPKCCTTERLKPTLRTDVQF